MFLKIPLILSLFVLSACAANLENGKISSSYKESFPIATQLVQSAPKSPLSVRVPQTTAPTTGILVADLISIAVASAANQVSRQKREAGINEITRIGSPDRVQSWAGNTLFNTANSASWLSGREKILLKNYDESDRKNLLHNKLIDTDLPTRTTITSSYVIGEYFENMSHNFVMEIRPIENSKLQKPVYSLFLTSGFALPGMVNKDFTDYRRWTENDGALLKKAILHTTKNINKQLKKALKNPNQIQKKELPSEAKPEEVSSRGSFSQKSKIPSE